MSKIDKNYCKEPAYHLNENGEFAIENYNFSKPFANFFPGIAGKYGIPMWVFYTNRGQAISSFGIKDKENAILEFYPANKSWQLTSTHGFRTFIKTGAGKKTAFYEPFHNGLTNKGYKLTNRMLISSHGLSIEEENLSLGIKIKIEYFNIPNDSYAGLARAVTVTNLSKSPKNVSILDGLPQVIPYGMNNFFNKEMSRTIEAWMSVDNMERGVPFYRLAVDPSDRPEVIHIEKGNFYLGFHYQGDKAKIITPIIDPERIFGPVTDFSCPHEFLAANKFKTPKKQIIKSKTPCAFLPLDLLLKSGEEKTFYAVVGHMRSIGALNSSLKKMTEKGYLGRKKDENRKVIEELQNGIETKSSSPAFDAYAKQTYLDNIMRGGYPVVFKTGGSESVFYLYSRKHGDLERDYNRFHIQPSYFSQGNGNYRDVNQNRRSDIWFNPQVQDANFVDLFNLLQLDGFNPLVVKGASFTLEDNGTAGKILSGLVDEVCIPRLASFLKNKFTPGDLLMFIEENGIRLKISRDELLDALIPRCARLQEAEHGEGFWIDHWTYNLDLLEEFLGVYPEKQKEILFDKKVFTFFDNAETVKPRSRKYLLYNGLVKQLASVAVDHAKKDLINARTDSLHIARTRHGKGEIYQTTLINKLLCLFVNKFSSLDPFGCGIEMEADKPNWYDALNGLPALLGSSVCETFELKRLAELIKNAVLNNNVCSINITEEVFDLLTELDGANNEYFNSAEDKKDYLWWDRTHSAKESYRDKVKFGVDGKERELNSAQLAGILDTAIRKICLGLDKAKNKKNNVYYSYCINEVAGYTSLDGGFVKPESFTQKMVPLFLEGQMHALRLADSIDEAKALYKGTRASQLYDRKLKMYKVTAPLDSMPEEIGRCRVFPKGWLENESIFLHMEYKYLLETLKQGLYNEFFEDFKNALIPFQDPNRYGRSILENSSFIVSSAFADKSLHGNGFVARLSGSTAEFLQMWRIMNIGKKPFSTGADGKLNLALKPKLPGWLFDKNGDFSFNFLGRIKIIYHNPKKKNTFGENAPKINKMIFNDKAGKPVEIRSDTMPSPYAEQIRLRQINSIEAWLV